MIRCGLIWKQISDLVESEYGQMGNGLPTFVYHRFWSQVDMATAYAEYDRLIGNA
ncbi:glycoside hydrolase family 48 protein [Bacillus licheniformis]|nr:glycoside hydrolase family 48 protein [Bacillus licheniformis]